MNYTEYNLANIIKSMIECLKDNVPLYLQNRLAEDATKPVGERLYNGFLKEPVSYLTGIPNQMIGPQDTPIIHIGTSTQNHQEYDASNFYTSRTTMDISVLISETDVDSDNGIIFLNGLSAYLDAIAWSIVSKYTPEYGCKYGAYEAHPISIPYGTIQKFPGQSVFYRTGRVRIEIMHRIYYGQTLVFPPSERPWTPEDLGDNLLAWFDPECEEHLVADSSNNLLAWVSKKNVVAAIPLFSAFAPKLLEENGSKYVSLPQGTTSYMVMSPTIPAAGVFTVARNLRSGGTYRPFIRTEAANISGIRFENDSTVRFRYLSSSSEGASQIASVNDFTIVGGIGYSSGSQIILRAFANGSEASSGTVSTTRSPFQIIGSGATAAGQGAEVDLKEILFTNEISEDDRERIEGYFAWKYGLVDNLPVNHPYKTSAPTVVE